MALLVAWTLASGGCAAHRAAPTRPAGAPVQLKTATKRELVGWYNDQANSLRSINASVSMRFTAGTAYSGVIKQYHEVNGFLLAQRPANIRVIGQAPVVGTNIFDMASDGEMFHIYIPSKNKFLEGPANLRRESAQPIENLRPQHLIEAVFWTAIPPDAPVLFEAGDESEARYYTLTVVREDSGAAESAPREWQITRKIWFDRTDMTPARVQIYDSDGNVTADLRYTGWVNYGSVRFARQIALTRPGEDYGLQLGITKLTPNEPISADKFELKQPPGTELVRVGEETKERQP